MSSAAHELGAARVACLNEALRQSPLMIDLWCSSVVDLLNERFTSSLQNIEKRHLHAAMLALQKHQLHIAKSFVAAVTRAAATQGHTASSSATGKSDGLTTSVSFDDLTLMGDNDVQDRVDSARVLQTVAFECDAGLAAFSARLSTAQGFAQVTADKNPLRPEIFSLALLKAARSVPVDSVVRSLWFAHGGKLMGQLVQALYLELNELLIQRGVAPAAYRVITNRDANNAGDASPASSRWADGLGASAFAPLTHDTGDLPTINFPPQEATVYEPQASNLARASIVPDRVRQSRSGEAVTRMIGEIANDSRLLAPVRQLIASTEPFFLRLAAKDPLLLKQKSHPARRLLAVAASKSLAYRSESALGFREFLQDLQQAVALMAQADTSSAQQFANLLAVFESKIAQRQAAAYANYKETTQSVRQAEQRNAMAQNIAAEILARPDFILSNRVIIDFLTGPWSQVLAAERLAVDADKTGMYKAIFSLTLGELLWSLNIERTAPHPKRLAKLSPSVLERIRGGLLSIDCSPADSQAFFDEVLAIHQSSLNPRSGIEPGSSMGTNGNQDAMASQSKRAGPHGQTDAELNGLFAAGDSAHGVRTKARAKSQKDEIHDDTGPQTQPQFEPTQPFVDTADARQPESEPLALQLGGMELRLGAWVEMTVDDQWVRAQLTWISLYKTLCIFTSAGGRTHSLTEPLLQYMLLQGMVKVISHEGVLPVSPAGEASPAKHNSPRRVTQPRQSSRF